MLTAPGCSSTVAVGGGDRLWFRCATGRMPAGLGQAPLVALFEPDQ